MKRLPLLLDDNPSPLVRAGFYLLVPVALVLALPILLLLILVLYLSALFHGARIFVTVVRREQAPGHELPKPHFLEVPEPAKALPDESAADHKDSNC
jgi:hypothetical protein